ncbi:MAG: NADH-quinone oxidoreductase subunit M [Candidatus Thalassarchaeaceae archaeon]|nr:NADH-quinone oxidoreductase subunit M [Candidatus Thalassarchaeaceae archaeon]
MEATDIIHLLGNPLTVLTLLPITGALLLMLAHWMSNAEMRVVLENPIRYVNLTLALLMFVLATLIGLEETFGMHWGEYLYQNCEIGEIGTGSCTLISSIGVSWHVGIDALSFPMVWLTTLLIPITMVVEWNAKKGAYFHSLILMMEGALIGVFVSLDLFVFYVFWELTLIPMFFLILMWGGDDRRYAAQKFFIYTFTASVFMLAGILVMYFNNDASWTGNITGKSFDFILMSTQNNFIATEGLRSVVFLLMLIGFATKLPSVPVHTWLPDAHVQAPTAGSMLLAGVMLKMGAYGFLRLGVTLFPDQVIQFQTLLVVLGMVSLVYGAIVCLGQINLKRMVAYSSVSHMGLIFLGIATLEPLGIAGAIFMMFAHGIISPLLFAVCGSFKHHYHTLEIDSMRGLAKHSPWMSAHMMVGWMGSLGLPLMAGFVAEVAVLIAFYMAFGWWVLLPALTLIVTATYYLWSMQRTIFEGGRDDHDHPIAQLPPTMHGDEPRDITWHENTGMLILGVLAVVYGIYPDFFGMFEMMSDWATLLVENRLFPPEVNP